MRWRWIVLFISSAYVTFSLTRGQLPDKEAVDEDPLKTTDKTGWVDPSDPWSDVTLDKIVSVVQIILCVGEQISYHFVKCFKVFALHHSLSLFFFF